MSGHLLAENSTRRARLLFVHAHPDDETLTTGLSMARYVSRGHDVRLLTCTLGEEGEVIPPGLAHLCADRDNTLGSWRRQELRDAMSVLGVTHSVLGEEPERGVSSRYRDSGMAGTPSGGHPEAFVHAEPIEGAALMAAHLRSVRPDVVVTYDEHGGYGHPDHIQTHRLTMSAVSTLVAEERAGGPSAPVVFCIVTAAGWAAQDRAWLRDNLMPARPDLVVPQQHDPYPPSVVPDETVTHVVEEPTLVQMQLRALARYPTQVIAGDGYYALSNAIAVRLSGREGFAQFDPASGRLVPAAAGAAPVDGLLDHPRSERSRRKR